MVRRVKVSDRYSNEHVSRFFWSKLGFRYRLDSISSLEIQFNPLDCPLFMLIRGLPHQDGKYTPGGNASL